jgi:predicted house-cleaning NTP pyrophosphatase (Maf/HAM1 superfamily)
MGKPPEAVSGRIVLASASAARASLLRAAGIGFAIEPAAIDEAAVKREARRGGESAIGCAIILATEKACAVSERDPDSLVIGADQLLASGAAWLDKPRDLDEARAQLLRLRGRTHTLAGGLRRAGRGCAMARDQRPATDDAPVQRGVSQFLYRGRRQGAAGFGWGLSP